MQGTRRERWRVMCTPFQSATVFIQKELCRDLMQQPDFLQVKNLWNMQFAQLPLASYGVSAFCKHLNFGKTASVTDFSRKKSLAFSCSIGWVFFFSFCCLLFAFKIAPKFHLCCKAAVSQNHFHLGMESEAENSP